MMEGPSVHLQLIIQSGKGQTMASTCQHNIKSYAWVAI